MAVIREPVQTDTGLITGTSSSSPDVRAFKGIPYAAPPVGPLRWRAPLPPARWNGILAADRFGPRCFQGGLSSEADPMSEDCLYLNVWTSATSGGERQPVMVWVHGGALILGAGSLPLYDGAALARKGAVVVTLNYRLGPFGWLAHPELTQESGAGASGNYGLMDVIAALQWVRANIAGFGGDPRNVTLFGESAGAMLTAALMGSPMAPDLFHRVIVQSGGWMGVRIGAMPTLAEAEAQGRKIAAALGAGSLDAMRARSAEDILAAADRARSEWHVIVDGRYIVEDLSASFSRGRQLAVDVMAGSNKDEGTFPFFGLQWGTPEEFVGGARVRFGDLADSFLKLYPAGSDEETRASRLAAFSDELRWQMRTLAALQARLGSTRAYVFCFAHEPPVAPGLPALGATHTAELAYVFSTPPAGTAWSDADRRLAETMTSYWVNFARSGDPNGNGLPVWAAFHEKATSQALVLDAKPRPEAAPDAARLAVYDALWARRK
jgi:para-nitrobenzyl esterase